MRLVISLTRTGLLPPPPYEAEILEPPELQGKMARGWSAAAALGGICDLLRNGGEIDRFLNTASSPAPCTAEVNYEGRTYLSSGKSAAEALSPLISEFRSKRG